MVRNFDPDISLLRSMSYFSTWQMIKTSVRNNLSFLSSSIHKYTYAHLPTHMKGIKNTDIYLIIASDS